MENKLKFPITARAEDLPPPMPLQHSPSIAVPTDHFVNALLGTSVSEKKPQKPLKLVVSFLLHIVVLGALVVAPLYFSDVINVKAFQSTLLVAPPSPAPPPAAMKMARAPVVAPHAIHLNQLVAPTVVPRNVTIGKDVAPPDEVASSMGAGDSNGVLGGILGGTGSGPSLAPPPPSAPATPKIVHVGGDVREPALLERVSPNYPPIARISRTEGIVVIDAVIDERGNVVQAHAISGPPLLMAAALQAVSQWKYQPTYLNGQAVSVAMHVSVLFHLQG
jgi:protein TonB